MIGIPTHNIIYRVAPKKSATTKLWKNRIKACQWD